MARRIRRSIAIAAALALMASGPAYAVGGPNEAGNSGKFHPNSSPCDSANDHPHCAGPH